MNEIVPVRATDIRGSLISVVTTTYNGSAYLRETIDSILQQTWHDFEYIIIDDCSTDQTVALIRSYDDPRIVFVQNQKNLGISESRNIGFRLARGRYILTNDQDDLSEPDRFERQVRFLDASPDISAVASRVYLLANNVRSDDPMPVQADPLLIHYALYFGRHNTTYSSLCLRRQFVIDNDLYFRPRYRYAEDYELCSRIVACGRFAILPEALVGYRRHHSNNSDLHYEEMSANGMAFMRDCYARVLGRPVDEFESRRIWQGLIEKQARSTEELRALGALMTELTAKFMTCHAQNDHEKAGISVLAAQIWHDIVDRSVSQRGLGGERVRREFDQLQAWTPTWRAHLKILALGAIAKLRAVRQPAVGDAGQTALQAKPGGET